MSMLFKLLQKVTIALDARSIPYMLSGSVAMNVYTVPRMTRDIDIVINLQMPDVDKFAEIFKEGYYMHKEGLEEEIRRRGMFNVIDFDFGQKIDFMVRKNTEFHLAEFERRKRVEAFGFPVWIVSIKDLILSKLIWIQQIQSDTQMRDIKNLLQDSEVDQFYLSDWIKRMNLETFNLINHDT